MSNKKMKVSTSKVEIEQPILESVKKETTISIDSGKVLIIKTSDKIDTNDSYTIRKDGTIIENGNKKENDITICLIGNDISWTQITSMINLIKDLQKKGAGKVERFDTFTPGTVNPSFNLRHALIKYGVR